MGTEERRAAKAVILMVLLEIIWLVAIFTDGGSFVNPSMIFKLAAAILVLIGFVVELRKWRKLRRDRKSGF